MFWDGERWIDEGARPPVASPSGSDGKLRRWLATGVMLIAMGAVVLPSGNASAAASDVGTEPDLHVDGELHCPCVQREQSQDRLHGALAPRGPPRPSWRSRAVRDEPRCHRIHDVHRVWDLLDRCGRTHARQGRGHHRWQGRQDRQHVRPVVQARAGAVQDELGRGRQAPHQGPGPGHGEPPDGRGRCLCRQVA